LRDSLVVLGLLIRGVSASQLCARAFLGWLRLHLAQRRRLLDADADFVTAPGAQRAGELWRYQDVFIIWRRQPRLRLVQQVVMPL
jgi:hypothetical protein